MSRSIPRAFPGRKRGHRSLHTAVIEALEGRMLMSAGTPDNWTALGDGASWNDPNNWSTDAVPGKGDDAVIGAGFGAVQIPAGSFAAHSLSAASPVLVDSGGSLMLLAPSELSSTLNIQNRGAIDITTGSLALNYGVGNPSPLSAVEGDLSTGAIFSSTAQANPPGAVGYADGSVDSGTSAKPGQVLVQYTLNGDANLDGQVGFADLVTVVQNFNKGGTDWAAGNFNAGPSTGFTDLVSVVQNFNKTPAMPVTTTALSFSNASPAIGQSVTFTATVKTSSGGVPTGTVSFVSGGTTLATAPVNSSGVATFSEYNYYSGVLNITAAYSGDSANAPSSGANALTISQPANLTTTADGLKWQTVTAGSGAAAQSGQLVEVDYTGYLYDPGQPDDGVEFDSSIAPGRAPFDFGLGEGSVIQGFDEGITGMQTGETRDIIIPPALAYGAEGAGGIIPANATLLFIVNMLAVDLPRLLVYNGTTSMLPYSFNNQVMLNQPPTAANGTDFGTVAVGSSSAAATFALYTADTSYNLGLTGDITLSGTNPGDFLLTQLSVAQDPSNGDEYFVFTVTFNPQATGTRTATVNIATTDSDVPDFTFGVTGVGA